MSKLLSNIFGQSKTKKLNESIEGSNIKKEKISKNIDDEDLPPIAIPRRLSLSKSGRIKEKKRSKLAIEQARQQTNTDGTNKKSESKSKSPSRESLDQAK